MDIRKIYEYALQREIEGRRFFLENAGRLSHAAAVETFMKLADEEEKHAEFIRFQIEAIDRGELPSTEIGLQMEDTGFFSQRANKEMLEQTVSEAMVPDLPILRMAYLIERDFSEFYSMAAQRASGATRDVLMMLSKWEQTHEQLFKYLHDKAFEAYAQMPWGG